jgi:hypothetical protein
LESEADQKRRPGETERRQDDARSGEEQDAGHVKFPMAMKAQTLLPQWIIFLTTPNHDNPHHHRNQKQHYRDRHSRHSQNSGNRPVEDQ